MTPNRTARIHRGFHRVGIVLAVLLAAVIALLVSASSAVDRQEWVFGGAIAVAVVYALSRALGWMAAGFFGD